MGEHFNGENGALTGASEETTRAAKDKETDKDGVSTATCSEEKQHPTKISRRQLIIVTLLKQHSAVSFTSLTRVS